jgi:cytochrome c556
VNSRVWLFAVGLTAVGSIGAETQGTSLHQVMSQVIAPQAQIIWNIGNAALDNDGNIDGAKISQSQWDQVLTAARQLKTAAHELARAGRVIVAAPGVKIQDEENAGAADARAVQRYIDTKPKIFRSDSRTLEAAADKLLAAAAAHDSAAYSSVSGSLDEVCEHCHQGFWYPQQSKKK